jgi:hypothetical protein
MYPKASEHYWASDPRLDSMILGTKASFAVQWELDRDPGGQLLFGRVCFWVADTRIGDYDLGTSLSDVLVNLQHPVGDSGNRHGQRFCSMTVGETFSLVQSGLFESDASLTTLVEDESWARFDVSIPVDVFDGIRMYLFDCSDCSRLLIGNRLPDGVRYEFALEQRLKKGEFDEVIRSFQRELETAFQANTSAEDWQVEKDEGKRSGTFVALVEPRTDPDPNGARIIQNLPAKQVTA